MASIQQQNQAMASERAARSVFVGNIPYEATEESMKEIFQQVGPVASFRIVYDRESGKPKGYGFCEYQDIETAQSAMRNLNNVDYHGRPLRVGAAAGDQSNAELKASIGLGGPIVESPYGEPVEPEKAPEAISKAVASLPPEQMFELMKQMKMCVQNNPNEARNMLLQNPQLAYALLQAQIVMKIVDPQVAMAMLHRQIDQVPPVMPSETHNAGPVPMDITNARQPVMPQSMQIPAASPPSLLPGGIPSLLGLPVSNPSGPNPKPRGGLLGDRPPGPGMMPDMGGGPSPQQQQRGPLLPGGPRGSAPSQDMHGPDMRGSGPDMRGSGPDMRGSGPDMRGSGRDIRGPGPDMRGPGPEMRGTGSEMRGGPGPEMRGGTGPEMRGGTGPEMRGGLVSEMRGPGLEMRGGPEPRPDMMGGSREDMRGPLRGQDMGPGRGQGDPREGRGDPRDPRGGPGDPRQMGRGPPPQVRQQAPPGGQKGPPAGGSISTQDHEKAALIMQVLQLSDEQIAMLPPDQRQSILVLKEQISSSGTIPS